MVTFQLATMAYQYPARATTTSVPAMPKFEYREPPLPPFKKFYVEEPRVEPVRRLPSSSMDSSVPAHQALKQAIAMKSGRYSDFLVALERHGYSRLVKEQQPAGNRCGRVQRNVDIVEESRRNGPQPSTRHE